MHINSKIKKIFLLLILSTAVNLLVFSCAQKPSDEGISSSSNPKFEIDNMYNSLKQAKASNIDVLSSSHFEKSERSLNTAKSDLAANKNQETILDDVRESKMHLREAIADSQGKQEKAPDLFRTRQSALAAGAASKPELKSELTSVDSDVAAVSSDLTKVSSEKLSSLQGRYTALEQKAVIISELGTAKAQLNGAKKLNADTKSPLTFKKAELSLKNAESTIATNLKNPESYRSAVNEAARNTQLLTEVTEVIQSNGKNLSEASALKIVDQRRQLAGLKSDIQDYKTDVAIANSQINAKNRELESQKNELNSAENKVALQKAIEKSRTQFTNAEAEAYQQGDKLIIRLKSVNFQSSSSNVPSLSMPLLAKVADVAKSLNATEIKIEGHTDSIGTAEANKVLSEKRAQSVADYLKNNGFAETKIEAEGVGFAKPIATNKSKVGRAQNRRVDIIISPEQKVTE